MLVFDLGLEEEENHQVAVAQGKLQQAIREALVTIKTPEEFKEFQYHRLMRYALMGLLELEMEFPIRTGT